MYIYDYFISFCLIHRLESKLTIKYIKDVIYLKTRLKRFYHLFVPRNSTVILSYRYEESDMYKERPPCSLRRLGGNILYIT